MNKNLAIAWCATVLSFCTLYIPQPILPLLGDEFGVGAADSALLITVTLAPLGLAPIVYGYFLQAIPARSMLRAAVLLLIVNQLAFLAASEFWHLLALRFAQGLLMPAIFTSVMTYFATMARAEQVRRAMGWYVAATILGGFLSRAFGGVFTEHLGWHWAFALPALMLLPVWFLLRRLDADAEINFARLSLRSIRRVLADPLYRRAYLALACAFMAFSGTLNLLPFRLGEVDPSAGPSRIALLYTGYLVGIPVAIAAERLVRASGRFSRAALLGLVVNAVGMGAYWLGNAAVLFAAMFLYAASMFFIHAALSGLVNDRATEHKGVINGLYVSVYYLSGALGSWLPGYAYGAFGWHAWVLTALAMTVAAAGFAARIRA
ncbi:MAG: MFS transporter [bacterium]